MPFHAIISDIHANLEALEAVLADIRNQDAEDITCLGDIVGYGPNPVECVDLVRENCARTLMGNHDAAMLLGNAIGFGLFARNAIEWHMSVLRPKLYSLPSTKDRWKWLQTRLPSQEGNGHLWVHASPRDPLYEYLQHPDFVMGDGIGISKVVEENAELFEGIVFGGHTHIPGVGIYSRNWLEANPAPKTRWFAASDPNIEYSANQKVFANAGSVGQPRDGNPHASYILYDGKNIRFRRVPYDIEKTVAKIKACPALDDRLGERLLSGV